MYRSPCHYFAEHYGEPFDLSRIAAAAVTTRASLEAFGDGDVELSERLWAAVDGDGLLAMWNRWNEVEAERGPVWEEIRGRSSEAGVRVRLSARELRALYERDDYRCRYCRIPVFMKRKGDPIVRMIAAMPHLTPGLTVVNDSLRGSGRSGVVTNADYSKILWSFASPDHVDPVVGGGGNSLGNLVTSCSGCNYSKRHLTLEQMDVVDPR